MRLAVASMLFNRAWCQVSSWDGGNSDTRASGTAHGLGYQGSYPGFYAPCSAAGAHHLGATTSTQGEHSRPITEGELPSPSGEH